MVLFIGLFLSLDERISNTTMYFLMTLKELMHPTLLTVWRLTSFLWPKGDATHVFSLLVLF